MQGLRLPEMAGRREEKGSGADSKTRPLLNGDKLMKKSRKRVAAGLTRRDTLKLSGVALGGLAVGSVMSCGGSGKAAAEQQCDDNGCNYPVDPETTQEYLYPGRLDPFKLQDQTQLASDEMRITFLGSAFPPSRRVQQMMSIFVEVGPWVPDLNGGFGKASDSFVFDCGCGVYANYNAMGIAASRMDKIFISHLHADHMSDLSTIYCFGPSTDRKWPLYVWGQGPSGVPNPSGSGPLYYDDGTYNFCDNLRKAMRWHSESFSFLSTSYNGYPIPKREDWGLPCDPEPVGDDAPDEGYALVPIELDWTKYGKVRDDNVAYNNPTTGVKITHFPVVHTRRGSMGYKLEWNDLTMIYTSDTRPETRCIDQANNGDKGVDVFIHEMILPPELLTMKNDPGLTAPPPPGENASFDAAVQNTANIEESSHTPQGAFGYLLTQLNPRPRLTVVAHFPVADDTVQCAMNSVLAHFPPNSGYPVLGRDIVWATDLMVLTVKKTGITQRMGVVSDYAFGAPTNIIPPTKLNPPKYPSPTTQIDPTTVIQPGDNTYCSNGY
jgi:ribonuclease Z